MLRRCSALTCLVAGVIVCLEVSLATSQDAKDTKKKVTLVVTVPQNDASLTIDGVAFKQTGTTRTFTSPALDTKGTYTYTLETKWEPNNYTKITRIHKVKVDPSADTTIKVDMTKSDP